MQYSAIADAIPLSGVRGVPDGLQLMEGQTPDQTCIGSLGGNVQNGQNAPNLLERADGTRYSRKHDGLDGGQSNVLEF